MMKSMRSPNFGTAPHSNEDEDVAADGARLPRKPATMRWPALAHATSVQFKCMTRFPEFSRHIATCRTREHEGWGYKLFSQSGEDGYVAALVDRVGLGPRKFVEFGFAPVKNNLLAFAMYHRAAGLFMDCSTSHCRTAAAIFRYLRKPDIAVRREWIDRENVDALIAEGAGPGEIDVLSIDVDGNDYWLWQSIVSVKPRIVVIEYNAGFGSDRAVTVVYDPLFDRTKKLSPKEPYYRYAPNIYYGASLAALSKLGASKGYSLVCCEALGVNAFFVRDDLLSAGLRPRTPKECFLPHRRSLDRGVTQEMQERILFSQPLVEI